MLINPPAVRCHCNHRCNLTKCIFVKEVQILLKAAELSVCFFLNIIIFGHAALALSLRVRGVNIAISSQHLFYSQSHFAESVLRQSKAGHLFFKIATAEFAKGRF